MIVGFARNLYWALPLLLLPIVYVLYGFPSAKNNKGKLLFWALLAVLLYIRFLCGYEYITTITFMVAALVAYHLYMQKSTVGTYIRQMTIVGIVAVMSFAAALGTHIVFFEWVHGFNQTIHNYHQTKGDRKDDELKRLSKLSLQRA